MADSTVYLLVGMTGYSAEEIAAYRAALSQARGITVQDYKVPGTLPIPVMAAAPAAPAKPTLPEWLQQAMAAHGVGDSKAAAKSPFTAPTGVTATAMPADPFQGRSGSVVAAKNGNGWKRKDPDMPRVWWLMNADARPMADGTSGANRWKTQLPVAGWIGIEQRAQYAR